MMKGIKIASLLLAGALPAMAGGILTNTNQNAAALRNISQQGAIDITGLYYNPAGTAFLSNGWHLSLNIQSAFQTRTIDTSLPLFAMNKNNPDTKHRFKGDAIAPVIPSFQLSYNHDKWSVNANFALGGGGGKCEFDRGLGTFEAFYAGQLAQLVPNMLPASLKAGYMAAGMPEEQAEALAAQGQYKGYSMNSYMRGRQYYFGLQLGATYKFLPTLSGFAGLRIVYANCNYNGYAQDIKAHYNAPVIGDGEISLTDYSISLNCDQEGWGVTPILGIDWRPNDHWNLAAKYEFKTRIRLKNKTEMNDFAAAAAEQVETLGQFKDGEKVADDIPGILSLGAQYSPIKPVRINAGFTIYFDKQATKKFDKQNLIDRETMEGSIGAEWDINKYITVSAAWQTTNYGLSDQYMSDLAFNLSANSVCGGVRINATKRCSVDLGYMHTFYNSREVSTPVGTLPTGDPLIKGDTYNRTNLAFGVGVNLHF